MNLIYFGSIVYSTLYKIFLYPKLFRLGIYLHISGAFFTKFLLHIFSGN